MEHRMNFQQVKFTPAIFLFLAVISLSGCGGGGSSSSPTTPPVLSSAATTSSAAVKTSSSSSLNPSSSSSLNSSAVSSSVVSSSKNSASITLNGVVTDNVVPFASVTFYVGDQTYVTKADANGKYSIKLIANEADFSKPIKAVAKGGEGQAEVEFVSLLPSFKALLLQAGNDATLDSVENLAINISNVTTAEYALIDQHKLNVTTDADLAVAQASLSETEKLTLAALIKVVVDNADYTLPSGVNSTLDLALNKTTTTNFLAVVNAKDSSIIQNTINDIKNDASLTPVSPLIGSWYFSDTAKPYPQQNHMLITFIDATHYTVVMDVENGSFNCKDGAEYGTYTWNSATGELTAKLIIDNNGECGVDSPAAKTYTLANSNNELVVQETGGNKTTLKKVANGAGMKGSWAMQRGSDIYVLTVLDDTHYIGSWPTDSEHDFEYGTYTYNVTTGEFIAKPLNFTGEFKSTITIKNNQLERTSGDQMEIETAWQRLPLAIKNSSTPSDSTDVLLDINGESYPLRVSMTIGDDVMSSTGGKVKSISYDFHKLDGTMTPCTYSDKNSASCHGTNSDITSSTVLFLGWGGWDLEQTFNTNVDQFGFSFYGKIYKGEWKGTWKKVATTLSSQVGSGTFSVTPTIETTGANGHGSTKIVSETGANNHDALIAPNGGEIWKNGQQQTISWKKSNITGSTVDLYLLTDNPEGLVGNINQNVGATINAKLWNKFASAVSNTGSYNLDPAILESSGNSYLILIVSSTDNTVFDISNNLFSITN